MYNSLNAYQSTRLKAAGERCTVARCALLGPNFRPRVRAVYTLMLDEVPTTTVTGVCSSTLESLIIVMMLGVIRALSSSFLMKNSRAYPHVIKAEASVCTVQVRSVVI